MKKLFIAASLVTALAGCQSNNHATVEQAQNFAQCTFPDAPTVEAPGWICDVLPTDLAAGATGYAKKSAAGMSVMRKIATNDARVNLAAQFETDVNNLFQQAVESSVNTSSAEGVSIVDENVQETFENITKTVVTRNLTNSRVIVSQASPAGGLYVLIGMDQATFDSNMNNVIDQVAGEDSALWDQFNNEQAAADLAEAFEALKK
ncbi:lipoprotein [Vibrio maerlii]|uniref:lipoprotein n=1 Tax=Vibrio maerlii TaxID=2231648 RepID=UPI000E3DEE23|nr:lipoprotein [Vibrio maerlii]